MPGGKLKRMHHNCNENVVELFTSGEKTTFICEICGKKFTRRKHEIDEFPMPKP